jgi:two-component system OmpR family response regulator
MARVLLVEDDYEFAELIRDFLNGRSIEVDICDDPFRALVYDLKKYDLLLLDLGLPGMDGLELCKEIRAKSNIAVIISSARGGVGDKVLGLQLGADDYLPKPYDPDELYARIITVLRRMKLPQTQAPEQTSDFTIKESTMEISYKNNPLALTATEFLILSELLNNKNDVVSKDQLLHKIASNAHGNSLESMVSKIRQKIKRFSDANHIIASRGLGYRFVE